MERVLCDRWGATAIVSRGRVHDALHLPALIAERAGMSSGLVTYRVDGPGCELVTLDALTPYQGTGTVLVEAVARIARGARCTRLWLITTNDNLDALRFYQRRGFVLVAVHRDAVTRARQLKPSISLVGRHGIPIRDELELERPLRVSERAGRGDP